MLTALLPTERIRVPLGSHSRHALFRELLELALPDADPATLDAAFHGVLSREAELSTAIGDGLAVPHGRTDAIDGVRMAAGIVEGVEDYQAPDGVPVRLCVLVVTSEAAAGIHLKVLGRLARIMRNDVLKEALFKAPDADAFAAVLSRAETT